MRTDHILYTEDKIDLQKTGSRRLTIPGLSDAILGGLFYLYDTHVHNASSHPGSYYDFLISAEKAGKLLPRLAAGFRSFLGRHIIKERHLQGTWPAYIHFLADLRKHHAKPLLVVTDYNLFTTASTAYSLLLFDDRHLSENARVIEPMLGNACRVIRNFKREEAYNFWLTRHDHKPYSYSAPLNIPVSLLDLRRYIYKYTGLLSLKNFHEADMLMNWVLSCYDKRNNAPGGEAIFNVPDDADNTSMAIAFQMMYDKWLGRPSQLTDIKPLEYLSQYRDLHRTKIDRFSKWIGEDTGAFLTWLKDEKLPSFSGPGEGVIPLAVNNVDIVINSNVLFALSLASMQSMPGYQDAIRLVAKSIEDYTWPDASLYYPQKFIFPYAISRAWRDADAREPLLDTAMSQLMVQILDEMDVAGNQSLQPSDTFKGTGQNNFHQSTALGLITLMNLGRDMAENCGLSAKYDHVVKMAVHHLIFNHKTDKIRQKNINRKFPGVTLNFWESGILYSSSVHQLAHWRSHAQTTSLVIEALAKYVLAYDLGGDEFLTRKISLNCRDHKWSLSCDRN
jgi:hypothetical protein